MPPLREILLVGLGGGIGSMCRYIAVSGVTRAAPGFPYGTLLVNVLGCFFMGLLAGWTSDRTLRAALGVGVLGGFTTFSAFGGDTFGLAEAGSFRLAAFNLLANVGIGLLAVWAGRALSAAAAG